jgi:hypothetical protein
MKVNVFIYLFFSEEALGNNSQHEVVCTSFFKERIFCGKAD